MWRVNVHNISMAEGDFGIGLPVAVSGVDFAAADTVRITVSGGETGAVLLEKDFSDIQENTFVLELTAAESAQLPVGVYAYSLDWYNNGAFMCNLIERAVFKVVDKV